MIWAKGYRELIDLMAKHKSDLEGFKLDVYGSGEDSLEVQSTARKLDLSLNFFKGRDHADNSLHGCVSIKKLQIGCQISINPAFHFFFLLITDVSICGLYYFQVQGFYKSEH